jgi:hypothetical protein
MFVVISSTDCYTNRTKALEDASIFSFTRLNVKCCYYHTDFHEITLSSTNFCK